MATPPIDYDAIFQFYDRLQRQRPLTDDESNRLALLYQRAQWQKASRLYREANLERIRLSQRQRYAQNAEEMKAATKESRRRNPRANRAACQRYRDKQKRYDAVS